MYCSQCGKKIIEEAKFCINCGASVPSEKVIEKILEEEIEELPEEAALIQEDSEESYDAVKELKRQIQKINNRRKSKAKNTFASTIIDKVKEDATKAGFDVDDGFEEKKIEDKTQVILDFPIPESPEALLDFAKYIYSQIPSKKRDNKQLTPVWAEKLREVYLYAKTEIKETSEFSDIKGLYKKYKRRERHFIARGFMWWTTSYTVIGLLVSLIKEIPFLLFLSILSACWEVYFFLYFYDLLDENIASLKRKSSKLKKWLKILKFFAWHLLAPAFAGLITSIIYSSVFLIWVFAVFFVVFAMFLLILYDFCELNKSDCMTFVN